MLSLSVHARVSYTTILESFHTSLLPKTRTKVSQTAHRLLSGSLNRPLRILSCFASRFFCIVALQLISPSVRCPYANALSLIHTQPSRCHTVANLLCFVSQWAILALLLEEPSVQGRVSSGFAGGREEREKEAQDKGRQDTEGKAPRTSSWEVYCARDGNSVSKGGLLVWAMIHERAPSECHNLERCGDLCLHRSSAGTTSYSLHCLLGEWVP